MPKLSGPSSGPAAAAVNKSAEAEQAAAAADNADTAEHFGRHLKQGILHRRSFFNQRHFAAFVHQVGNFLKE